MSQNYGPGFDMHSIHASQLGLRSLGWHDAIVDSYDPDNRLLTLTYVPEPPTTIHVWYSRVLDVPTGQPARVHEELRAVDLGGRWIHVLPVSGGRRARVTQQSAITSIADGTGIAVNLPPAE